MMVVDGIVLSEGSDSKVIVDADEYFLQAAPLIPSHLVMVTAPEAAIVSSTS